MSEGANGRSGEGANSRRGDAERSDAATLAGISISCSFALSPPCLRVPSSPHPLISASPFAPSLPPLRVTWYNAVDGTASTGLELSVVQYRRFGVA